MPDTQRELGARSSLDSLKKEAKAWLKALRAGDPAARNRLIAALGEAPADPGLRQVQLALAREHGLPGWTALKEVLEDLALALRTHDELAELLLRSAKPWDSDKTGAARIWARVSPRTPGLTRHSIHLAVMAGDLDEVRRRLAQDPATARRSGGPLDWQPLQYLAYGRLPGAEGQAVEIARLLLEAGADPNVAFDDGWDNPFTLLNGVIGMGEQDRTSHPRAMELALLFLDHGKAAFDTQVNYDTSLGPDETIWLELLWSRSDPPRWHEKIYGKGRCSTLTYLLGNAVDRNHPNRTAWLLEHGADPNGVNGYSFQPIALHAQREGKAVLLDLLVRHGAKAKALSGEEAFVAACLAGHHDEARRLAAGHPGWLHHPGALIQAARRNLADAAALLLELGMDPDVCPHDRKRALHWCAQCGSVEVARLLLAAGADVDARGSPYEGTPLDFALHFEQQGMIDLLAPLSRDIFGLVSEGLFERAEAVLRAEPARVSSLDPHGATVLFLLPDDEDKASQAVELLLSHGADPRATNAAGETAAQVARKRGLDDAAGMIEVAAGR